MTVTSKNQLTVETVQVQSITGKNLNYVKITNAKNESVNINVGEKTYTGVIDLTIKENLKEEKPKK